MKYNVILTEQAKSDLAEIRDYIKYTLYSEINSQNTMQRIKTAISKLDTFPESHPVYKYQADDGVMKRYIVCGNYLIFYAIDTILMRVIVTGILYGRRDLAALV